MKISEIMPLAISENKQCEFKATLDSKNVIKWAKTIVGFANGDGGYLIVGVNDNGDVIGLSLDDIDKIKNLVSLTNDRYIFPHAKFDFSFYSVTTDLEKYVLCINVRPSEYLTRFKDGDYNEKVFIKGDANSTPATPEEIIALGKKKYGVDNCLTDIEYKKNEWSKYNSICADYRESGDEPSIKELQSKNIIGTDMKVKYGFLMFKDDYAKEDTAIHCRLWKGLNKAGYTIDKANFSGSLSTTFEETMKFIEKNTKVGWRKTPNGGRDEIRSYPKLAVREALVNAIAHRDYSISGSQIDIDIYDNRIDITSPGSWLLPGIFADYNLEEIPSIRRNEIIASCLEVANLMECSGSGFQTIFDSYRRYDKSLQPSILCYEGFFIVRLLDTLYDTNEYASLEKTDFIDKLETEKQKVLDALALDTRTTKELFANSDYESKSYFTKNVISALLKEGKIERLGKTNSPKAVYVLSRKN